MQWQSEKFLKKTSPRKKASQSSVFRRKRKKFKSFFCRLCR